ncbi:hypothetical protein D9Q98_004932 [Chlorella vulgaris]|uniref:C3H1-type domain-containing protein n=1 Tax=Chlorella vulgaris TaxID=3077 RepID=A0A9D4TND4_CHLVU|nr:hypothetical protein D9Q98_004932 [Chlorella vulgaris]
MGTGPPVASPASAESRRDAYMMWGFQVGTSRRRDPRLYTGIACPNMKQEQRCELGNDCPFAHTVLEYWLHPSRYHTQLCSEGLECKRKVCFFAHSQTQLRSPACQPAIEPAALLAAAAAAAAAGGGSARCATSPRKQAQLSQQSSQQRTPAPEDYSRALAQMAKALRREPACQPPADVTVQALRHSNPPASASQPVPAVPSLRSSAPSGAGCDSCARPWPRPRRQEGMHHKLRIRQGTCAPGLDVYQPSQRLSGTAAARLFADADGLASVFSWDARSSGDSEHDSLDDFAAWRRSGN